MTETNLKTLNEFFWKIFASSNKIVFTGDGLVDKTKPIVVLYPKRNEPVMKLIKLVTEQYEEPNHIKGVMCELKKIDCETDNIMCRCNEVFTKDRVKIPLQKDMLPLLETSDLNDLINGVAIPIDPLHHPWHQIPFMHIHFRKIYCKTIMEAKGYQFNYDLPKLETGECPIECETCELIKLKCGHTMSWEGTLKILSNENPRCPFCREDLEYDGHPKEIETEIPDDTWDVSSSIERMTDLLFNTFNIQSLEAHDNQWRVIARTLFQNSDPIILNRNEENTPENTSD